MPMVFKGVSFQIWLFWVEEGVLGIILTMGLLWHDTTSVTAWCVFLVKSIPGKRTANGSLRTKKRSNEPGKFSCLLRELPFFTLM